MLTLEIKNQQLNTTEDFSVTIEDQNPATEFEEIPGSKGVGIELPINETNRTTLNNPERFEKMGSIDDRRFEGAALRHHGQVVQKGTLVIDEATSKSYSGWLRDVVGNLAERVAGKLINQTTLGGEKPFINKTTYDPLTDGYACPKIFNRHFWRDRGKRSKNTIETTDLEGNPYNVELEDSELSWQFLANEEFLVNFPTGTGVKTDGSNTAPVVSPMLFLWNLVELVLSDNYIFVKENFLKEDEALRKLILYNNFNILDQQIEYVQKIIFQTIYFEDVEMNLPASVITTVGWSSDKVDYQDLVPKISLGKLILSTQNLLNVVFSFNDLDECRIVDRQKLLTAPAYNIDQYMDGEWELSERKDVTVKLEMEHDSNDFAFSDNWQDLSDLRDNIKEPVLQRADLDVLTPEMDEIRKVTSEDNFYQYHWYVITTVDDKNNEAQEDILGWEMITIGFQPYFYNDGDREIEEIETSFSTLRQSDNGYPITMQKGNAKMFKTQHEAFTPRLLFYEGDEVASYRTNGMALDFDGDDGLANKRWNYWLPFWANRLPAVGVFKLPASEFYYIKNNKAILPLKTRHGSFIIDKIEAVANKEELIECKLTVFKRESVVGYQEGTVPGEGEEPAADVFEPVWLGLTSTGKPYLVNVVGEVKIPPSWGTLSPTTFAGTCCIDFDPVNKLLYVGGYNGMLYITDFSDPDNMVMKGIKVFASGNVSAVSYVNGVLLIGKDLSNEVYVQPCYADLAGYADNEATAGSLSNGYTAKGFIYSDEYYYACTKAGEVHRTNNPSGPWAELFDIKADFRKMVATTNKLLVFGKDDNHSDDRAFSASKSNPASWNDEFDVEITGGIYVSEAIALSNDQALIITNKEYGGAKLVNSNNSTTALTPSLAKTCGGACADGSIPFIAIKEGTGATKIASYSVLQSKWNYVNVPLFFTKLFIY